MDQLTPLAVEWLMHAEGLQSVVRGRPVRTTIGDEAQMTARSCRASLEARRQHQLWVAIFHLLRDAARHVYVAFASDVFSGRILG